jgi:hypothetical protein
VGRYVPVLRRIRRLGKAQRLSYSGQLIADAAGSVRFPSYEPSFANSQ